MNADLHTHRDSCGCTGAAHSAASKAAIATSARQRCVKKFLICAICAFFLSSAAADDSPSEHLFEEANTGTTNNVTVTELGSFFVEVLGSDDAVKDASLQNTQALFNRCDTDNNGFLVESEMPCIAAEILAPTVTWVHAKEFKVQVDGKNQTCNMGASIHSHSIPEGMKLRSADDHGHGHDSHGDDDNKGATIFAGSKKVQCKPANEEDNHGHEENVLGKAVGFSFILCFISFAATGVVLFTAMKNQTAIVEQVTKYLSALAIGALVGDSLIHLVPASFGIHNHTSGALPSMQVVGSILLCSIVGLYCVEAAMKTLKQDLKNSNKTLPVTESKDITNSDTSVAPASSEAKKSIFELLSSALNFPTYVWLNLGSDVMCNFLDGLAIGASFNISQSAGIASFTAVLMHEIPQELADAGVLLQGGFSTKSVLFSNVGVSLFSLIGSIVGAEAGQNAYSSACLAAFIAGFFLYLSLVDLAPLVINNACKDRKDSIKYHSICIFVMSIGWLVMLGLTYYEEHTEEH